MDSSSAGTSRGRQRGNTLGRHRVGQEQSARGDGRTEDLRGECRRRRVRDHDLAGAGRGVGSADGGGCGADHHQLPVHRRVAREDEVDGAAVDAAGGAEHHPAHRGAQVPDPAEHPVHAPCGTGRSEGVPEPVEQQQHRVTAPLQQVGALDLGDVHQGGEHRVQDVAELLGPGPALLREPLGQPREAGDVEQHQAGVELTVRQAAVRGRPARQHPGRTPRAPARSEVRCPSSGRDESHRLRSQSPRAPGSPRSRRGTRTEDAGGAAAR